MALPRVLSAESFRHNEDRHLVYHLVKGLHVMKGSMLYVDLLEALMAKKRLLYRVGSLRRHAI